MADSLILMVMALVVFGPRRLPQIGRQIGKLMYEFRKASNDFKFQMEEELRNAEEADRRKKEEEERQRQLAANPPAQLEAGTATTTETTEAPAAAESLYPSGGTYGEIAEAQEKAAKDQSASTVPTIQPPSTGEPVPAAWPAGETCEAEPKQESDSAENAEKAADSQAAPVAVTEVVAWEKEKAVTETAREDAGKTAEQTTEPAHNG